MGGVCIASMNCASRNDGNARKQQRGKIRDNFNEKYLEIYGHRWKWSVYGLIKNTESVNTRGLD